MSPLIPSLFACLFLLSPAQSAVLSFQLNAATGSSPDPLYPTSSTLTTSATNQPGVVATLSGRGYGVEEDAGASRWGVAAGNIAWLTNTPGWTIRNGFFPNAIGSTLSTTAGVELAASYMSVTLRGLEAGTVLNDVELTFTDVTFMRPENAWAGASTDAFASPIPLSYNKVGDTRQLSVTFPELTQIGTEPLEMRIYGVVGVDIGAFNVLNVKADMIPVPEPGVPMLMTVVMLGAAVAFRRRPGSPGAFR